MSLLIVCPPGIQYSNETYEQMCARDRWIAKHNAAVLKEWQAWQPGPAKFYESWCRKHAPHLLNQEPKE